MTIRWPGCACAWRSVARAWLAPSQTAAASSKLMSAGLMRQRARLAQADVLRVGPEARAVPEHRVADLERRTAGPTASTSPASSTPSVRQPRPSEPADEPTHDRSAGRAWVSDWVTVARADPDEDLVVLRDRLLDLLDPEDLRRPVPVLDDGSHVAASW